MNRIGNFYNETPNSLHLLNALPQMEIQFLSHTWPPFIFTEFVGNITRIYGPLYMLLLEVAIELNAS